MRTSGWIRNEGDKTGDAEVRRLGGRLLEGQGGSERAGQGDSPALLVMPPRAGQCRCLKPDACLQEADMPVEM